MDPFADELIAITKEAQFHGLALRLGVAAQNMVGAGKHVGKQLLSGKRGQRFTKAMKTGWSQARQSGAAADIRRLGTYGKTQLKQRTPGLASDASRFKQNFLRGWR